jgi:hypothetical protein
MGAESFGNLNTCGDLLKMQCICPDKTGLFVLGNNRRREAIIQ